MLDYTQEVGYELTHSFTCYQASLYLPADLSLVARLINAGVAALIAREHRRHFYQPQLLQW
jgi:hypothetical protein